MLTFFLNLTLYGVIGTLLLGCLVVWYLAFNVIKDWYRQSPYGLGSRKENDKKKEGL